MPSRKKPPPPKKAVQVSLPPAVIKEIDARTGARGRSAFILQAILGSLRAERSRDIDAQLAAVYGDPAVAEQLHREVQEWAPARAWPPDDDLVEEGPIVDLPKRKGAR
jgi:hypothetical protein